MFLPKKLLLSLMCVGVLFLGACSNKQVNVFSDPSRGITESVVRTAYTQVGKPYKLGGTSPATGFDCSGLIFWAYKQNGIAVPRITVTQAKAGQKAPKNALRPGDILVFRSKGAPNGLHTGMYLGNNRFLHAPNSRSRIKIEPLKGSYWGKNFLQARRIIGPVNASR